MRIQGKASNSGCAGSGGLGLSLGFKGLSVLGLGGTTFSGNYSPNPLKDPTSRVPKK